MSNLNIKRTVDLSHEWILEAVYQRLQRDYRMSFDKVTIGPDPLRDRMVDGTVWLPDDTIKQLEEM